MSLSRPFKVGHPALSLFPLLSSPGDRCSHVRGFVPAGTAWSFQSACIKLFIYSKHAKALFVMLTWRMHTHTHTHTHTQAHSHTHTLTLTNKQKTHSSIMWLLYCGTVLGTRFPWHWGSRNIYIYKMYYNRETGTGGKTEAQRQAALITVKRKHSKKKVN